MKQMRSRFRLLTLLLVCAFLVTLTVCTGAALKTAGITLSSLLSASPFTGISTVSPSVSPETSPGAEITPAPSDDVSVPSSILDLFPGTDNSPDPEYNVFGL